MSNKLDDAIHEALSEEDAEFLAQFEKEPNNLFSHIGGLFSGPLSWVYILFFGSVFVFGPIAFFTGWKFFAATDLRPLFYWGFVTNGLLLILSIIRILLFMQIQTNMVLREIKRLELQVARLAAKERP